MWQSKAIESRSLVEKVVHTDDYELLVRVYDAPSGIVEWDAQPRLEPGHFEGSVQGVALSERAVYVAGVPRGHGYSQS